MLIFIIAMHFLLEGLHQRVQPFGIRLRKGGVVRALKLRRRHSLRRLQRLLMRRFLNRPHRAHPEIEIGFLNRAEHATELDPGHVELLEPLQEPRKIKFE